MRHGHPTEDGIHLTDLGQRQVAATRDGYLKEVQLLFAAVSETPRAVASLETALRFTNDVEVYRHQTSLGYEWLLNDTRLPQWVMPEPRPTNAMTLIRHWPPALLLGHMMWRRICHITRAELIRSFEREGEKSRGPWKMYPAQHALIVSHGGTIEPVAAASENRSVPLASVPMLGHADILLLTVMWNVDEWGVWHPRITAIEHLPCPIPTPREPEDR